MALRRSSRLSASTDAEMAALPSGGAPPSVTMKRKADAEDEPAQPALPEVNGFAVPSTPKRIRSIQPLTASTPTPAAVKLMSSPSVPLPGAVTGSITERIADPHFTNAPLSSPMTSRVLANKEINTVSPSKSGLSKTTTANILEQACAHLVSVDERMQRLIDKYHCALFSPEGLAEQIDPFSSLCSGIISQQVSGAAAKSIKAKFIALFNENSIFPSPSEVVQRDIATLRTAGLSQRKAEYIHGLAEKFVSGELSTEMLMKAEYEEVLEKLIAVRGLGKWSVEMFACFGLKRMDVFSTGDLGVQYVFPRLGHYYTDCMQARNGSLCG